MKSLDKVKTEPKKLECWEIQYRQFWQNHSNWNDSEGLDIDCTKDFIQSLIQSTKEETIRDIMGLECMKNEKQNVRTSYRIIHRNQLRNQIKTEINSLLKK